MKCDNHMMKYTFVFIYAVNILFLKVTVVANTNFCPGCVSRRGWQRSGKAPLGFLISHSQWYSCTIHFRSLFSLVFFCCCLWIYSLFLVCFPFLLFSLFLHVMLVLAITAVVVVAAVVVVVDDDHDHHDDSTDSNKHDVSIPRAVIGFYLLGHGQIKQTSGSKPIGHAHAMLVKYDPVPRNQYLYLYPTSSWMTLPYRQGMSWSCSFEALEDGKTEEAAIGGVEWAWKEKGANQKKLNHPNICLTSDQKSAATASWEEEKPAKKQWNNSISCIRKSFGMNKHLRSSTGSNSTIV